MYPHLLDYFSHQGQPDPNYFNAVRKRFAKCTMDICTKTYDQQCLNYQYEIALRYYSSKKNKLMPAGRPYYLLPLYGHVYLFLLKGLIRLFLLYRPF